VFAFFKPTVIFDLDNTLVECTKYYEAAKLAGARHIEATVGMPAATALDLLQHIDVAAIKSTHDFSRARLPNSFASLAEIARRTMGRRGSEMLIEELYAMGDAVFDAPYELLPGVEESLEALYRYGYQLVLLTKGDDKVQQSKIDRHPCLTTWFRAHYIVPRKGTDVLERVLKDEDIDSEYSWVVGDSYRDDIAPALALGVKTALVSGLQGHPGYSQERDLGDPAIERPTVADIVPHLHWHLKRGTS
jgi:putative hydrolase of the HAD superfamily